MRIVLRLMINGLLPLALLGAAGYQAYRMVQTPSKAKKSRPEASIPLVEVADLSPQDVEVIVEAFGTVAPAREVVLRTEVGGRILGLCERMVPGGVVSEGETLVRIDPASYAIAVRQAEAHLIQAKADFDIEQGQQVIAKRGWELLKDELGGGAANQDLALRKPQLERAEAARAAAQAALEEASLDLQRTTIIAPFDSLVLEESVEIGQLVERQSELARLVGAEEFWVHALVPLDKLDRICFPGPDDSEGSSVRVILSHGSGTTIAREGEVLRFVGDLDPKGRMARVLISIRDPLETRAAAEKSSSAEGKLLLGSYVRLEIEAGRFEGVYSIPRTALRENSRVWVRSSEGVIRIHPVEILWRREEDVLVANSFARGDRLVTSRLSRVMPGMRVRVLDESPPLAAPSAAPATRISTNEAKPDRRG